MRLGGGEAQTEFAGELGLDAARESFAVDEHAIAVEDHATGSRTGQVHRLSRR